RSRYGSCTQPFLFARSKTDLCEICKLCATSSTGTRLAATVFTIRSSGASRIRPHIRCKPMNEEELKHFTDILETFDTAMLVTQRGRELRSRPMEIVDRSTDGRVWFITSIDSAKLEIGRASCRERVEISVVSVD